VLRKLTYTVLTLMLFYLLSSLGYSYPEEKKVSTTISLGVKIGMIPSGGLHQFALIYYKDGRLASIQPVTTDRLIKVGTGKWPIPGTRKFHDFFAQQNMYVFPEDSQEVFNIKASIDSLWKVRFAAHPFDHAKGDGWSQGDYRPSLKQQEYIFNRYGVRGYDQDYFVDSSFFKLMKDVQDPEWIEQYKSMH